MAKNKSRSKNYDPADDWDAPILPINYRSSFHKLLPRGKFLWRDALVSFFAPAFALWFLVFKISSILPGNVFSIIFFGILLLISGSLIHFWHRRPGVILGLSIYILIVFAVLIFSLNLLLQIDGGPGLWESFFR